MIAETIRRQLGQKALAMLGARDLLATERGLKFKIGKNSRGITHIVITLADDDTYTVTFWKITKGGLNAKAVIETEGVYADNLHHVIEIATGLYTSL